jgi:N-acetyltransferase
LNLRNGDGNVKLEYIPLTGTFLRLQPLTPGLKAEVRSAVDCDPDTWAIMPVNPMGDGFDAYWAAAWGAPTGERMAYAIRRRGDDRVIGMSTYYTGLLSQGGVEIGTSFLHPSARGEIADVRPRL